MAKALKQFKEQYSPAQRLAISALLTVALVIVATAERDLQRRPSSEVRGSKLLWRVVCLNALGAAAYFRWGRRQSPQ
jgi:hypothetical protein